MESFQRCRSQQTFIVWGKYYRASPHLSLKGYSCFAYGPSRLLAISEKESTVKLRSYMQIVKNFARQHRMSGPGVHLNLNVSKVSTFGMSNFNHYIKHTHVNHSARVITIRSMYYLR